MACICGINKHLTTHTARHTFATTVTLENDVPLELLECSEIEAYGQRRFMQKLLGKNLQEYERVKRNTIWQRENSN